MLVPRDMNSIVSLKHTEIRFRELFVSLAVPKAGIGGNGTVQLLGWFPGYDKRSQSK